MLAHLSNGRGYRQWRWYAFLRLGRKITVADTKINYENLNNHYHLLNFILFGIII
jgi:hypothetical protein